jgi:hypothetical protein
MRINERAITEQPKDFDDNKPKSLNRIAKRL